MKETNLLSQTERRAGRMRWWIAWILFGSTAINYISRQTFSVLSAPIASQFHFTHTDLGRVFGAFQVSYAVTWLLGGMLLDAIGTRAGLAIAVVFWSVVNMLTGLADSLGGFILSRLLLGIGEGFNWPGANKAVAEWFPKQERSVAVAVFDSGSSVGGALAVLVVPWIGMAFGWRWSFVFSGVLGFVWLFAWLRIYRRPEEHERDTAKERAFLRTGPVRERRTVQQWVALARDRNVWGTVLGRALTDPIWWFYVFWLPQYLADARGFSLRRIAIFAWMPFVAADVGNFTGGLLSSWLVRRGVGVLAARRWVCAVSCAPMLLGIPAARVHDSYAALILTSVAVWGYAAWSTMGLTLPSDLFPADVVATVTGLSGLAAGLVGALFTYCTGVVVDRYSYQPVFVAAGLLPLAATACVFGLVRWQEGEVGAG